ncbi:hypothetical protein D3C71_2208640 [compost metagenome]
MFTERAGQQAEVVQAAEQAVDQDDGRALALFLEMQKLIVLQNNTLSVVGCFARFLTH